MNKNFISVDKQDAINSYGTRFSVGENVIHESKSAGTAVIQSFEIDKESNEVRANTSKGYAHIDFIAKKIENKITIDTDKRNNIGYFLICQVDENGKWDTTDESRTILLQRDTDLPLVAKSFGLKTLEPSAEEAVDFLENYAPGTIIDDPGYFE